MCWSVQLLRGVELHHGPAMPPAGRPTLAGLLPRIHAVGACSRRAHQPHPGAHPGHDWVVSRGRSRQDAHRLNLRASIRHAQHRKFNQRVRQSKVKAVLLGVGLLPRSHAGACLAI